MNKFFIINYNIFFSFSLLQSCQNIPHLLNNETLKQSLPSHTDQEIQLIINFYNDPIFQYDKYAVIAAKRIMDSQYSNGRKVVLHPELMRYIFSFLPSSFDKCILHPIYKGPIPYLDLRYEYVFEEGKDNKKTFFIKWTRKTYKNNSIKYFFQLNNLNNSKESIFQTISESAHLEPEDWNQEPVKTIKETALIFPYHKETQVLQLSQPDKVYDALRPFHHSLSDTSSYRKKLWYSITKQDLIKQKFVIFTYNNVLKFSPTFNNFLSNLYYQDKLFYHSSYPFIIVEKTKTRENQRILLFYRLKDIQEDTYSLFYTHDLEDDTTIDLIKNLHLTTKTEKPHNELLFVKYKILLTKNLIPLVSTEAQTPSINNTNQQEAQTPSNTDTAKQSTNTNQQIAHNTLPNTVTPTNNISSIPQSAQNIKKSPKSLRNTMLKFAQNTIVYCLCFIIIKPLFSFFLPILRFH